VTAAGLDLEGAPGAEGHLAATEPGQLFPLPVIRGLLRSAIHRVAVKGAEGAVCARFAVWVTALEGAVELWPDILELLAHEGTMIPKGPVPDFTTPTDALGALVNAPDSSCEPHNHLISHRSARVRWVMAEYHDNFTSDADPSVRLRSRFYPATSTVEPPWWDGLLPEAPETPEAVAFGALCPLLKDVPALPRASELAPAFRALPAELRQQLAPWFLPALVAPPGFVEALWESLIVTPASAPLAERVSRATEVVERLGRERFIARFHGAAFEGAVARTPPDEQPSFLLLLERIKGQLQPELADTRDAYWAPAPRRVRSTEVPEGAPLPPHLFEQLTGELAIGTEWAEARFAQHPRARFELIRGLDAIRPRASAELTDVPSTLTNLADLVGSCLDHDPTFIEAMSQALAGLLRRLDLGDPLHRELCAHQSVIVREALARSLAEPDLPAYAAESLADPDPLVWMGARAAVTGVEPWRGLFTSDPFLGASAEEAARLAPLVLALDQTLPRVGYRAIGAIEPGAYQALARVVAKLPVRLAADVALRVINERADGDDRGLVAAALLALEGGWDAWAAHIARRPATATQAYTDRWLKLAMTQASAPLDGGATIPWPLERRRIAAKDALRHAADASDEAVRDLWRAAAVTLWPEGDDPFPLPGCWHAVHSPSVMGLIERTQELLPGWELYRHVLEGARAGFPTPWIYGWGVEALLERLPAPQKLEVALSAFVERDGPFGNWARRTVDEALCTARERGGPALRNLLGHERLSPEHLLNYDRLTRALPVLRARLAMGLADLGEGFQTLCLALSHSTEPWTAEELGGWRSTWSKEIEKAIAQGPGGVRGAFVTLAPPGLWEPLDRSFVHAVAEDATPAEAQAIARRLAGCGDALDVPVVQALAARHPDLASWTRLATELKERLPRG
jgi:hypothetical protein